MEGVGSLEQTATAARAGVRVERCTEIGEGKGGKGQGFLGAWVTTGRGSNVFIDDCIILVVDADIDIAYSCLHFPPSYIWCSSSSSTGHVYH